MIPPPARGFLKEILGGNGDLILHSNEIGDAIGTVTVRKISERQSSPPD
jgi:hypothetical protein